MNINLPCTSLSSGRNESNGLYIVKKNHNLQIANCPTNLESLMSHLKSKNDQVQNDLLMFLHKTKESFNTDRIIDVNNPVRSDKKDQGQYLIIKKTQDKESTVKSIFNTDDILSRKKLSKMEDDKDNESLTYKGRISKISKVKFNLNTNQPASLFQKSVSENMEKSNIKQSMNTELEKVKINSKIVYDSLIIESPKEIDSRNKLQLLDPENSQISISIQHNKRDNKLSHLTLENPQLKSSSKFKEPYTYESNALLSKQKCNTGSPSIKKENEFVSTIQPSLLENNNMSTSNKYKKASHFLCCF